MKITIYPTVEDILYAFGAAQKTNKFIKSQIMKTGCWGFIEDDVIHVFYNRKASKEDLLELITHELTHTCFEYIRDENEEDFCTIIARLAKQASQMVEKITA